MVDKTASQANNNAELGPKLTVQPKLGPKLTTKTGCFICDQLERPYCIHGGGPGEGSSDDAEIKKEKREQLKQIEAEKTLAEEAKIKPETPKPNYHTLFHSSTSATPKNISELLAAEIDNNIISISGKGNLTSAQIAAIQKVFDAIIKIFNEFKSEWMKQNPVVIDREYIAAKTKDGRGLEISITDPNHRKSFLEKLLSLKLIPTPKNKQEEEEKYRSKFKPRNPTSTKLIP